MSSQLPDIPETATLSQWQAYMKELVRARGWNKASDLEIFLLFSEEVGEFAKAFRRYRRLFAERIIEDRAACQDSLDLEPARQEMAEELADVFSYLLDLAARLEIDLEQAFVAKERDNRSREWELSEGA
jgi:NTP pyrophosphatase (non-canonical NTP hydrolase)